MTANQNNIQQIVARNIENIKAISEINRQVSEITMKTALEQAKNALETGKIEAEATSAILDINLLSTSENAISDIQMLGARQALMLSSKAIEMSVLIAQFREKILGMFITLIESRTGNIWQRTKTLTQGFKF